MAKWSIETRYGVGTIPIKGGDERICEIFGSDPPRDKSMKRRRARLIAAARELNKAVRAILVQGMNESTVERAAAVVREIDHQ